MVDHMRTPSEIIAERYAHSASVAKLAAEEAHLKTLLTNLDVDTLPEAMNAFGGGYSGEDTRISWLTGDKFSGGYGDTVLYAKDYWTLRARSIQLFEDNLYAYGIIKRLVTNEINTGLMPEATPESRILGLDADTLAQWSEDIETRFLVWANEKSVCDYHRELNFGQISYQARMDAIISGDVLQILRIDETTGAVNIQIVPGERIRGYPTEDTLPEGHRIVDGVQLDQFGRHYAYWYVDDDEEPRQILAYGPKSGRRIAKLCPGLELRSGEVRGTPLLSRILQSLREIDRYRDSAQRKAVVNSIMAMFIKRTIDKPGSLPMTRGAAAKEKEIATTTSGSSKTIKKLGYIPGLILEHLQPGEEPVMKGGDGTDINFGAFEDAIVQAMAWTNEIPPEIVRLAFSNNYSASQAAINEFKIYLNKVWSFWGASFCAPVYREWVISEALRGSIPMAFEVLEASRSPEKYDIIGAWLSAEWYGQIKPSTDVVKQAKGSQILVSEGWSTNAREARINTGTKFSRNVERLARENAQKAAAWEPLISAQERAKQVGLDINASAVDTPPELSVMGDRKNV